MTNTGNEKPSTAKPMTPRSSQVPAFHAARMPSGMATESAMSSVQSESAIVGSTRCKIMRVTGWPS